MPMTIYDKLGNDYKINIRFWKVTTETAPDDSSSTSTWQWDIEADSSTLSVTLPADPNTLVFNETGIITEGQTATVSFTPDESTGTNGFSVDFDFFKITSFAADNSVKPQSVDGYPSGSLVTFSVGSDGVITGIYDNGQQQALGLIAISNFENPAGLQKVGDNMYIPTTNSGDFKAVKPGSGGTGTLNPELSRCPMLTCRRSSRR